jgi:hypothetical protein
MGSRRIWAYIGIAMVAALGLAIVGLSLRSRVDPALAGFVEAYPGVSRLASDQRGTEVTGIIDNKGTVPVDVTVRFRALDVGNNVVSEVESGPHRGIAPGASKTVPVKITATPIERWEMDIVELAPTPR